MYTSNCDYTPMTPPTKSAARASAMTNGNLTSDGTNTNVWDRANRLLSMGGSSYAYDGVGNRVSQTVETDVTRYLLDVQPELSVVLSVTTGANTTRYMHTLRGIHAQQDSAGNWEWMVSDGLGSVRGVAANDLTMLESRLLDPNGKVISGTGTNQTVYHRLHWSRWQFERLLLH